MIWGVWSQYPKIALIPSYPRARITEPSDGLYAWVGSHYISNVELKIYSHFFCMSAPDLGYFSSPPKKKNAPITLKLVKLNPHMIFDLERVDMVLLPSGYTKYISNCVKYIYFFIKLLNTFYKPTVTNKTNKTV